MRNKSLVEPKYEALKKLFECECQGYFGHISHYMPLYLLHKIYLHVRLSEAEVPAIERITANLTVYITQIHYIKRKIFHK